MASNVRFALALCLLIVFCSACQSPADSPPTSTAQPIVTAHPTEEAIPTGIPVTIIAPENNERVTLGSDSAYSLVASSAQVFTADSDIEIPDSYPPLPEDHRFVIVTATVTNISAEQPITIEREQLALFDSDGSTYPPVEVEEGVSPLIYDLELAREESLIGFALFAIPEDVTPEGIQWCPDGDCEQMIQSPFVLPSSSP